MNCHQKLQALGLSDTTAAAALHYLADHLAHTVKAPPHALAFFQQAFTCGVRAACDELRHEAGDNAITVDHHPTYIQRQQPLLAPARTPVAA